MRSFPLAACVLLLLATPTLAAPPPTSVTACGQAIPNRSAGVLAADLDCTGFAGVAVTVGKNSTLDLGGFTLTGGNFGIACGQACGGGLCPTKCRIVDGTVAGAVHTGIIGDKVRLDHVTVRDHGERGVDGSRQAVVESSTITGNADTGVIARDVIVRDSTITGNGRVGIDTTVRGRARVSDSTVTGNDTHPVCMAPEGLPCFDLGSAKRPQTKNTTCGRSYRHDPPISVTCGGWCVCTNDAL